MAWMTRGVMVLVLVGPLLNGCSTAPVTQEGRDELVQQATATMNQMSAGDPGVDSLIRRGYGYALFPEVTKGGLVFGGGYGQGVVYAQGQHIGYASLAQASFGLQVGGHTYRELIVFENKAALDRFGQPPLTRVGQHAGQEAPLTEMGVPSSG